jgi:hypothetical protein
VQSGLDGRRIPDQVLQEANHVCHVAEDAINFVWVNDRAKVGAIQRSSFVALCRYGAAIAFRVHPATKQRKERARKNYGSVSKIREKNE